MFLFLLKGNLETLNRTRSHDGNFITTPVPCFNKDHRSKFCKYIVPKYKIQSTKPSLDLAETHITRVSWFYFHTKTHSCLLHQGMKSLVCSMPKTLYSHAQRQISTGTLSQG